MVPDQLPNAQQTNKTQSSSTVTTMFTLEEIEYLSDDEVDRDENLSAYKIQKLHNIGLCSDPQQLPNSLIADSVDLKAVATVYRNKAVASINDYLYGRRQYSFIFAGIDNSILQIINHKAREMLIRVPTELDRRKIRTKCDIQFPKPAYLPDNNFSIDISAEIKAVKQPSRRSYLTAPIENLSSLHTFYDNLLAPTMNFVGLQNVNPNFYFCMDGAVSGIKHKLLKENPYYKLNPEQLQVFNAVMEFMRRPLADVDDDEVDENTETGTDIPGVTTIADTTTPAAGSVTGATADVTATEMAGMATPDLSAGTEIAAATTATNDVIMNSKSELESSSDDDCLLALPADIDIVKAPMPTAIKKRRMSAVTEARLAKAKRRLNFDDIPMNIQTPVAAAAPAVPDTSLESIDPELALEEPPSKDDTTPNDDTKDADAAMPTDHLLENLSSKLINSKGLKKSIIEVYLVRGSAGTGKTFIMDALDFTTNVLYITIKGTLVQDVTCNFGAAGMTLCKFMCSVMKMNFFTYLHLANTIERLPVEMVEDFVEKLDFNTYAFNRDLFGGNICLFIDEYSMISASMFRFIYTMLKTLTKTMFGKRILLLLAGDSKQIQPIRSIYGNNCQKIEDICHRTFDLVKSERMKEPSFVQLLQDLFVTDDMRALLMNFFPNVCNAPLLIEYDYPVAALEDYPSVYRVPFDELDDHEKEIYCGQAPDCRFRQYQPPESEQETPPTSRELPPDLQQLQELFTTKEDALTQELSLGGKVPWYQATLMHSMLPSVKAFEKRTLKSLTHEFKGKSYIDPVTKKATYEPDKVLIEHLKPSFDPEVMGAMSKTDLLKTRQPARTRFHSGVIYNLHLLSEWWSRNKSSFNRTIFLSKTNAIVHQTNIQAYLKCRSVFAEYVRSHPESKLRRGNFIRFAKIYHKTKVWAFQTPRLVQSPIKTMYILPLVIGMQYTLLTTISHFRNGDNLYLIGFLDLPNTEQSPLIMADERNQIILVYPTVFDMHLFKGVILYGFPLCMNAALNIYNSQGRTLMHENIYMDLQNCAQNEVFVALSRARKLDQIKCVFY